jgi:DNA-directed RNA polymerase subunit omega
MASKRAKDIDAGAQISIPKNNDKSTIVSLREIAEDTISLDGLLELAKRSYAEKDNKQESIYDTKLFENQNSDEFNADEEELTAEDMAALSDIDAILNDNDKDNDNDDEEEEEGEII